jgi:hypothetical protein
LGELGFAADEVGERGAGLGRRGGPRGAEELGFEEAQGFELVGAEIAVALVLEDGGQLAVADKDGDKARFAGVGLGPEGGGPFLFDPAGAERGGGEEQEHETGFREAVVDAGDDVLAVGDFEGVEPAVDLAALFEDALEGYDGGLVGGGVGEEDFEGHGRRLV